MNNSTFFVFSHIGDYQFILSYLSPFPHVYRTHGDQPNDLFIFDVLPNMGHVMLKWNHFVVVNIAFFPFDLLFSE